MIQFILIFIFGFLCATVLALLVAPPIWNRAALLTQRRIEAQGPQTLAEIQADKDGIRADYAMAARRLEMSLKACEDKNSALMLDVNTKQIALRKLNEDAVRSNATIADLTATIEDLRKTLGETLNTTHELRTALGTTELSLENRSSEFENLQRHFKNLTTRIEGMQVDLTAKDADIQRSSALVTDLRQERRDAETRNRELASELKLVQESLRAENKRYNDLQKKLEQMMTTLTNSEEKLQRREKDYQRLDEQFKKVQAGFAGAGSGAHAKDDELREQMNALAAEVVAMVALMEGPSSPIHTALAAGEANDQSDKAADVPVPSLADRIRALQQAVAASKS